MTSITEHEEKIWNDLINAYTKQVSSEHNFSKQLALFLNQPINRVNLIRHGLHGEDKLHALYIAKYLNTNELMEIFNDLIFLAGGMHGVAAVRLLIKSLPRKWVTEHIEKVVDPLLEQGIEEDYRRYLELYTELDPELMHKLAIRATMHNDADIREAGQDFLEIYSRNNSSVE